MFEQSQLLTFLLATFILVIVPGPAVLYVIARSIAQGRVAGLASVAGLSLGGMVHTAFAALGLSAILATSAFAFSIVKFAGAGYLIYLGIKTLLASNNNTSEQALGDASHWQIFRQGVVVSVLNPKTALFFLAFLPQFANPTRGNVTIQLLLLGLIFVVVAVLSDSVYALLAGSFGRILKNSPVFQRRQKLFSGTTYIALGLVAAFGSKAPQLK